MPVGYGLGVAGVIGWAIGGALDVGLWHRIFGIERGIEALLRPTHLLLAGSEILMLTSPLRAAWSDPTISRTPAWGAFFPTLLSATLTAQVVGFMFMYEIAFLRPVIAAAVTVGIPSVLITNLILIGTMLLLLRRWQTPTGSIVLTFGVFAAPLTAIGGFTAWPAILPALAAGLVADLLIRRLGAPEGERNTLRIVPTVTSLTL